MSSIEPDDWEDQLQTPQDRVTLVTKPTQSGKTFVMIEKIKDELQVTLPGTRCINVIVCDNSLVLTDQTAKRIEEELTLVNIGNSSEVYAKLSSKSETSTDLSQLIGHINTHRNVNNILMCANGKRMEDLAGLIDHLNDRSVYSVEFTFNIWMDEADKFTNFVERFAFPIIQKHNNTHLFLLTASPSHNFFQIIGDEIRVHPIEEAVTDRYHGWSDNKITRYDNENLTHTAFVEKMLKKAQKKALLIPGNKWFIPAKVTKKQHETIATICCKYNMVAVIINGDGIKIRFPDAKIITASKTMKNKQGELMDINQILLELYKIHNLHFYIIVITGNYCISRGISLLSNEFMLDYAILSDKLTKNKRDLYQLGGRLTGNVKHLPNYKPTIVFATEHFDSNSRHWEQKSKDIARIAYDKEQDGYRPTVTKWEAEKIAGQDIVPKFEEITLSQARECEGFTLVGRKKGKDGNYITAKVLLDNGEWPEGKSVTEATVANNPTAEYTKKRFWGLAKNEIGKKRFVPLNNGNWAMYWKEKKK